MGSASYARSPRIQSGRHRGRPRSALERRNRIDKQQRFLRIMPVGTGQTDRERHTSAVADHMAFAPSLGPVGGIRQSSLHHTPPARSNYRQQPATNQSGRGEPANPASRSESAPTHPPVASRAGVANTSSRPAAEFLRQHLPGDATAKDKENARKTGAVRHSRPATLRSS
jgi:hypothetical protein